MAIPGADIVSQHRLDDSDLRAGLARDEALLRQFSTRANSALVLNTSVAQKSLTALNKTIIVLGGSTALLGIETAAASIAIWRLVAAVTALEAAILLPVTILKVLAGTVVVLTGALAGLTAAGAGPIKWLADWIEGVDDAEKATQKLTDKLRDQRKARDELRMKSLREATAREAASFGPSADLANPGNARLDQLQTQFAEMTRLETLEERMLSNAIADRQSIMDLDAKAAEFRRQYQEEQLSREEELFQMERRTAENRAAASRDLLIRFGGRRPSEFEQDPELRKLLEIGERLENQPERSGFSIGTRASSEFRFGSGAPGSVIGQQTEQKKTNEQLKRLNDTEQKMLEEIAGLRRDITGNNGGQVYQPIY